MGIGKNNAYIVSVILIFSITIIALGQFSFAEDPKYMICFCTTKDHSSVHFFDGSTGQEFGRGHYANGAGSDVQAPPVPNAGVTAPSTGGGNGDSSSTSGSSSDSSSSSSSGLSSGSSSGSSGSASGSAIGSSVGTSGAGALSGSASGSASSSSGSSSGSSSFDDIFGGQGKMQDDDGILDKKCICFEVTKEQYDQAVEFTNNYDLEYELFDRNCVDFVEALADELGLDIPETEWFWDISTPGTFYDSLNEVMSLMPPSGIREDGAIIKYGNDMHRIIEERTQRDFPTSGTQHSMADFTLPEEALEKLAVNPQLQGNRLVMSDAQKSLTFSFASDESVGELEITLPRMLIDASGPKGDLPFTIFADGYDIIFKEIESTETTRTVSVAAPVAFTDITIIGTEIISDTQPLTSPADETIPSPLKQIQHGLSLDDVICKPELTLLKRTDNGYPICVKEASTTKLISWGFAVP